MARGPDLGPLDAWALRDILRFTSSSKGGQRVLDFFRDADSDKSGDLTMEEFKAAIERMGFAPTESQLTETFAVCDMDGSGTIWYAELDTIIRQLGSRPPPKHDLPRELRRPSDGFPLRIDPDARFAQSTYVQASSSVLGLSGSRPGSRASSRANTPRTLRNIEPYTAAVPILLRAERLSNPEGSLARALGRIKSELDEQERAKSRSASPCTRSSAAAAVGGAQHLQRAPSCSDAALAQRGARGRRASLVLPMALPVSAATQAAQQPGARSGRRASSVGAATLSLPVATPKGKQEPRARQHEEATRVATGRRASTVRL